MYLTLNEFITMGGSSIDETAYNRLEYKARRKIDKYTLDRLHALESVPECVKTAMYEIIYILREDDESDDIKSVSHDGISVNFADKKSADSSIYDIICEYLTPDLLYRGVKEL